MTELVLCVRARDLFLACPELTEQALAISSSIEWLSTVPAWFVPREEAEQNPSYKQIIPYSIVVRNGTLIGVYKRSKAGSETRLHDTKSIGFGGHVEVQDIAISPSKNIDTFGTTLRAARREIYEELGIDASVEPFGCIYNPTNEVGRVHVGVIAIAYIANAEHIAMESSIASLDWLTADEIDHASLEPWSEAIARSFLADDVNGF